MADQEHLRLLNTLKSIQATLPVVLKLAAERQKNINTRGTKADLTKMSKLLTTCTNDVNKLLEG